MYNAIDEPQTIVLIGGTSDIGVAVVRRLLSGRTRAVVLACRALNAGDEVAAELRLLAPDADVSVVEFEAHDHSRTITQIEALTERIGDIDIAIIATGILGDQDAMDDDPMGAVDLFEVNTVSGVAAAGALARIMRGQGHGRLVILSSVAGERIRRSNAFYGASKAALDAFGRGLDERLAGSGVSVLIVRPGFVATSMTADLEPAPLSTNPAAVADAVVAGLRGSRRVIWVPSLLRYVFAVLRALPTVIWRRLPIN